jgi:hypothetical protein
VNCAGPVNHAQNNPWKSKRKEIAMADNKPQRYKETERFSIRRLSFWLSIAGIVYSAGVWDVIGLAISSGVLILTLVSKLISEAKDEDQSDHKD